MKVNMYIYLFIYIFIHKSEFTCVKPFLCVLSCKHIRADTPKLMTRVALDAHVLLHNFCMRVIVIIRVLIVLYDAIMRLMR